MSKPRSPHAHGPSEIWADAATRRIIAEVQAALAARLRVLRLERGLTQDQAAERAGLHGKHLQRMEKGTANATVATLAALGSAYGVPMEALFARRPRPAFRRLEPAEARPYLNSIPLYSLKAAAGRFGAAQVIEGEETPEAWVVPATETPLGKGLFVAQVIGESMNQRIPNGAFCLFRAPVLRPRSGQVLLVQHRDVRDPDHGGRYTVKVFRKRSTREGANRSSSIVLEPDSTSAAYQPIELASDDGLTAIAELVEVLPAG